MEASLSALDPVSFRERFQCRSIVEVQGSSVSLLSVMHILLLSAWKRFPVRVLLGVSLSTLSAGISVLLPWILKDLTDSFLYPSSPPVAETHFMWLLSVYGLLSLVQVGFAFLFETQCSFFLACEIQDMWTYYALQHFYDLPPQWHNNVSTGKIGDDIKRGGEGIWYLVKGFLGRDVLINVVTLIFTFVVALYTHPHFWWIWIPPVAVFFLAQNLSRGLIADTEKRISDLSGKAAETYFDGTSNLRIVRAFGMEEAECRRYALQKSAFHLEQYVRDWTLFKRDSSIKSIHSIAKALVIGYAAYEIHNGRLTVGGMMVLLSYLSMIQGPIREMSNMMQDARASYSNSISLFELLTEKDPFVDHPNATDMRPLEKCIRFDNVSFRYADQDQSRFALEGITLTIKRTTTTGLVGTSGAGKSTLIGLLLRFYDPSEGHILWDDVDLCETTNSSRRTNISVVPQECSAFNRSVAENISYGRPDASKSEIMHAAKEANAHDFIMSLPNGYDTVIGERGVKLSGGQRQRLVIARALLTNPSLLILDESTSSLDSESEEEIQRAIQGLHHTVTQIIIAHRFSTIKHADQIVVLDKGKIIAVGDHSQLLQECPLYRRLYKLQAAEEAEESKKEDL